MFKNIDAKWDKKIGGVAGEIVETIKAFLRALLTLILILQFVFHPTLSLANSSDSSIPPAEASNPIGISDEFARELSEAISHPQDQKVLNFFFENSEALQKGTLTIDPSQINNFKFRGQRLDLFEHGKYIRSIDLTNPSAQLPEVSVSQESLRIIVDQERKELVFEYVIGMHEDRTGGQIQARHVIPDLDVSTFSIDPVKKHIYILERNGQLHAMHGNFYLNNLFKNPIPIVTKLYEITGKDHPFFKAQAVRSHILNSGTKPFTENMYDEHTIVRRSADGQEIFENRDLFIEYVDERGQARALGVFSHRASEKILNDAGDFLFRLVIEHNPSHEALKIFEDRLVELERFERSLLTVEQAQNPIIEDFVRRLDPKDVQRMFAGLSNSEELSEKAHYNLREWQERYNHIREGFLNQKGISPMQALSAEMEAELKMNWHSYVSPVDRTNPVKEDSFEKLFRHIYGKIDFKKTALVLAGTASVYFSFPHVFETSLVENKIILMNWIYNSMYPPIMKESIYRSELLASMAELLFLWPLVFGISYGFQKFVEMGYNKFAHSNSKTGVFFRNLHDNWGQLGHWQRIISFGMRIYSYIVYPYVRFMMESVLRQKDFASSVDSRLNPFQKVRANSELGKRLNLTKNYRVGLNNVVSDSKEQSDTRVKIQSEIRNQKNQATNIAWVLATVVVSQESGIDLATLQMIADRKINSDDLKGILQNTRLKTEWELIAEGSYKEIVRNTQNFNMDLSKVSVVELAEFYAYAKELADRLKSETGLHLALRKLASRSKQIATDVSAFLMTSGYKEAQFYKKMYVGEYSSGTTFREATVDIPFTIITMGLIGDRADISTAESRAELTAMPGAFLDTNPRYSYEILYNYWGHWVSNGAKQAIVWQALDSQERHPEFENFEKYQYRPNDRHQSIGSAIKDWIVGFAPWNGLTEKTKHLPHSTLFESSWAGFKNAFATLQARMTISVLGRLAIPLMAMGAAGYEMSVGHAFRSFAYSFFATQVTYTIFMDIIYAGNAAEEMRIRRMNSDFDKAVLRIASAHKKQSVEEIKRAYLEGYTEMIQLYHQTNKKALQRLEGVFSEELHPDVAVSLKESSILREYYGVLAEFAIAIEEKNESKINEYRKVLSDILSQGNRYTSTELAKLNAQGILNFAMSNPPIYFMKSYHTARHNLESTIPLLNWSAVTGMVIFAAWFYSTTAVEMFKPEYTALSNTFLFMLPAVFAGYLAFKIAFSKSSWEFYLAPKEKVREWAQNAKELFERRKILEEKERRIQANKNEFLKNSCQLLFR